MVIGAPIGSLIGSHLHRLVLASFVYGTNSIQLIGALCAVQPWIHENKPGKDKPVHLCLSSLAIVFAGLLLFAFMTRMGLILLNIEEERRRNPLQLPSPIKKKSSVTNDVIIR